MYDWDLVMWDPQKRLRSSSFSSMYCTDVGNKHGDSSFLLSFIFPYVDNPTFSWSLWMGGCKC